MHKVEYDRFCYKGKSQVLWDFMERRDHFLSGRAVLRTDLGRKESLDKARKEENNSDRLSIVVSSKRKGK